MKQIHIEEMNIGQIYLARMSCRASPKNDRVIKCNNYKHFYAIYGKNTLEKCIDCSGLTIYELTDEECLVEVLKNEQGRTN